MIVVVIAKSQMGKKNYKNLKNSLRGFKSSVFRSFAIVLFDSPLEFSVGRK